MASQPHPPPLPMSSSSSSSSADAATGAAPLSAVRSFLSRLSTSIRAALRHRRPWPELLDRSSFSRPLSLSDATHRLRRNSSYFRVNYLSIISLVLALSLLSHPLSLLLLAALLAAWLFLYLFRPSDHPLTIFGRTFSDRETLGMLIVSTVVIVFLTSVGSVLVYALLVGVSIVSVHGAFRDPEDLFLDDQESAGAGGLLSFLGRASSSAVAAADPAIVAARV